MPEPIIEPAATPQDPVAPIETPAVVTPKEDPAGEKPAENPEEHTLLGDNKDDDDAKGDDKPRETGDVPEKYELTLPEDMELDADALELFSPIFKELGLSNENAQKLVEVYAPLVKDQNERFAERAKGEFKTMVDGWKTDTMKELGADAKSKLATANKAIDRVGSPELREVLDQTGLGNNKAFVTMMAKVGEVLGEDGFVEGNDNPPLSPDAALKKMYPTMNQ